MGDLIDKNEAIKAINELTYPSSLVDVKRILVDLPSVEQEQKTGKWIKNEASSFNHIEPIFVCSECGLFEAWGVDECYPYCPHCGAKMDDSNNVSPSDQYNLITLIDVIRRCINTGNRGNSDYFIVDQIEEIIDEYEGKLMGDDNVS